MRWKQFAGIFLASVTMMLATEYTLRKLASDSTDSTTAWKVAILVALILVPPLVHLLLGLSRANGVRQVFLFHFSCWLAMAIYLSAAAFIWHRGLSKDADLTIVSVLRFYLVVILVAGAPFSLLSSAVSYVVARLRA